MKYKSWYILLFALFAVSVMLISCIPAASENTSQLTPTYADVKSTIAVLYTSTPVTVTENGKASVFGKVVTVYYGDPQPLDGTVVRLAKVHWNDDHTDGIFVLEGGSSPSTISHPDGSFAFVNINPGEYVLIVGDILQEHEIISEANGDATIWDVPADEVTDFGVIEVYLSK